MGSLGLGLVIEDEPSELSCNHKRVETRLSRHLHPIPKTHPLTSHKLFKSISPPHIQCMLSKCNSTADILFEVDTVT